MFTRLGPKTRERSQGWPSIAPYGRERPVCFIVLPKANIRIESYKWIFIFFLFDSCISMSYNRNIDSSIFSNKKRKHLKLNVNHYL